MKKQHTPGPWMAPDESYNDLTVWATKNGKTELIASSGTNQWCNADEAHANARLIAAAPELLEALKIAIAADQRNITPFSIFATEEWEVIKAAIAKATGEKEEAI